MLIKVGSKKHLASKSVLFHVELISSSFLDLILKQVRLRLLVYWYINCYYEKCYFYPTPQEKKNDDSKIKMMIVK